MMLSPNWPGGSEGTAGELGGGLGGGAGAGGEVLAGKEWGLRRESCWPGLDLNREDTEKLPNTSFSR